MSESEKPVEMNDFHARRTQIILDENRELKQYVADVMKRLQENEALFARLFELESQILSATDSEDLCFTLLRGLRSGFDLDMARLWFDSSSFMGQRELKSISELDLIWIEKGEIEKMGLAGQRIWLLKIDGTHDFPWLETRDKCLASLALLVLGDLSHPFGILAMGSIDGGRFSADQSTDFLQHLAQIIGLTLENSVVRERLARLSVTDSLTGAHNHRFFQPHSHQPLSQWFGRNVPVACLYFNVDDFKSWQEQLGASVSDELLLKLSQSARQCIRGQDSFIRMNYDEFVVFLPACSVSKATEIAQRMVNECRKITQNDKSMGISVGVSFSTADHDKIVKKLVEEADQAMYVAQALGGSRVELASVND